MSIQAGKILLINEVRGDPPIGHHLIAEAGIYIPFINPQGAVSVEVNGALLGLKPGEFEWLDKPPKQIYERQQI